MIIINKSVSAVTEMSHKGKQMTSSNQRKKNKNMLQLLHINQCFDKTVIMRADICTVGP